jgi:hypothetical protein
MTQDKRDEHFHQIEKMEKNMNENSAHMVVVENKMDENRKEMENHMEKKMDENSREMKNKMDENWNEMEKHMEKKMLQLKNSMYFMFLHALYERIPIGDITMQGNHENIYEINIESQNHDYSLLQDLHHRGFNSTPRDYLISKIYMIKLDGKVPITWIFQMDQFFDLHQVPSFKKVTISSLYFKNDQFVWYQWFCERKKNYIISWSIFRINWYHIMGILRAMHSLVN